MSARPPRSNIHCHTRFSDGQCTMEEMVQSAVRKGFVSLGFSEHAWAPYDGVVCIKQEDLPRYHSEFARLREQYAGQIELYLGLETDCYHVTPRDGLDYLIGAAHYLYDAGADAYYTVDYQPESFEKARDLIAGGDVREMLRLYFDHLLTYVERNGTEIIGHLDLVTKLNDRHHYFDQQSAWYRRLIGEVADRAAASGRIVEVNTGGIARGYKTEPYPSRELLGLLRELNVPVLLSSDAHSAENLDFWFDEAEDLLRKAGYRAVKQLRGGAFVDTEL